MWKLVPKEEMKVNINGGPPGCKKWEVRMGKRE
jgi:hypothetical protein